MTQDQTEPLFPWEGDDGAAPDALVEDAPPVEAGAEANGSEADPPGRRGAVAGGEAFAEAGRDDITGSAGAAHSVDAEVDAAAEPEGVGTVAHPVDDEEDADAGGNGAAIAAAADEEEADAGSVYSPIAVDDEEDAYADPDADAEVARAEMLEAGARVLARERPVARREYFSISEVCEIVGLKPHVLRYWETQFGVLNPSKNRSGNRVYQRKEIRLILLVKTLLYEEKYTVDGARAKLDQMRRGGELPEATGRVLDRHMVQVLRTDLQELLGLLSPPRA